MLLLRSRSMERLNALFIVQVVLFLIDSQIDVAVFLVQGGKFKYIIGPNPVNMQQCIAE